MSDTDEPQQKTVIGIAFGNSNSSIAFTGPDGKAEVIANEEGDRQIPSVLSYVGDEEYHGAQAKSHLVRNPRDTIAFFRDYLGKSFAAVDPTNAHSSAHPIQHDTGVAFSVQEKTDADPATLSVSEVTTRHIKRLSDSAADFLGKSIDGCVITVPTDFSESQRKLLAEASKGCGLTVLQIIHEPVAALLAYAAREETSHPADKTILVVDVGGTRTDAAVIAARGGMYTLLATQHDYELGGRQFDEVLVDHFSKEFMKKHKTDPRENERSLAKLRLECENTKKTLSLSNSSQISIDSLAGGLDFHSSVNRLRYDLLSKKLVDQVVGLVESVVKKAEMDLMDINEVILAGGTSHTPKLALRIQQLFPATTAVQSPATTTTSLNPAELCARGAAIQASLIAEFDAEDIEQSTHPAVTVTPHLTKSLGVVITSPAGDDGKADDKVYVFLESETAVPARRTATFTGTNVGGDVLVRIVEAKKESVDVTPAKEAKEKVNGADDDEDDDDDDDEDDEDEKVIKRVTEVERVIAEALLKDVKKGAKVEVMLNVAGDLTLTVTARVVGGQGGVRGTVPGPAL
ncbi:Heat shock protein [Drechslerella dactyloides]|uniref:Heat shock protein n=1 Tax=Drechslerella dactyloides TaxID=74499 RepID=A0AAD6NP04_DREDA|nr:Heat shock protein [Drechslerella dactyloides]